MGEKTAGSNVQVRTTKSPVFQLISGYYGLFRAKFDRGGWEIRTAEWPDGLLVQSSQVVGIQLKRRKTSEKIGLFRINNRARGSGHGAPGGIRGD
jgi:hypothetical protein